MVRNTDLTGTLSADDNPHVEKRSVSLLMIRELTLVAAVPLCLFLLGLFYYWFAVADRYAIFLYGHGAPAFLWRLLRRRDRSRYWMAGLVAAGAVMMIYTAFNWTLGRLAIRHRQDSSAGLVAGLGLVCAAP